MTGTVFSNVDRALSGFAFYRDYRAGVISQEEFAARLDEHAAELGDDWLLGQAKRFPADDAACVAEALKVLERQGFISDATYPQEGFDAFRTRVRSDYEHETRSTYIFPEEERLVYALASIVQPRLALTAGSYYAYWAIWAMPAVAEAGGRAILCDPDPAVCALAGRNLDGMGYADVAEVRNEDAMKVYPTLDAPVDLMLLDASGPGDHPDPDYHGKRIYYPLLKGAFEHLADGALVVVHNAQGAADSPSMRKFYDFVREHFTRRAEFATTCGVGVYAK